MLALAGAEPAGAPGGVHTEVRVLEQPEFSPYSGTSVAPGRYAVLTATDSGTGIASGDLPHIFEPVFTTRIVGEGTGLGLATVRGIVTQS